MASLTNKAAKAAWDRLQVHVQLGDDAPLETVGYLQRRLDGSSAPTPSTSGSGQRWIADCC